ncbi:MAG: 2-C-methyl-D-erythritol 4-phosphate cytidylyltransferase [Methanobrevibacter sp.]|uniref:IspD/TarI family cytidylyltransferase n=1 Tax=Methanobrevibacter sp. TaxID=66852 RepID=UPI0025D6917B|nr:2-C-methyl-D-erythritol 4-phosphate cytidylyltransferase [Methanobrevibacter sp.]MBE6508520.1 2-C-methyl-D-erythritol 4-phosphate cytidylyltransferase [Methanobrevibacter sp.]
MIFAAILAGGTGTRLGKGVPKQFFKINNKPLLAYCIEPFLKVDLLDKIIVSSPKQYLNETQALIDEYFDDDKLVVIEGGKTRNYTILNSIEYAIENGADDSSVMVTHDGARIFVSPNLIEDSIKYAIEFGAASPVIPAVDVIFQSKEDSKLTSIPERKYLFHAQTPQSFNIKKYIEIYEDLTEDEIKLLDEAMMLFYLRDEEVYLFKGDSSNFKITRPFDITISQSILGD